MGKLVGGTSEVVFRRLDVAFLEVFFGLKIDHQQSGFVSTGFDGCHHFCVFHTKHWHAIYLKKAHTAAGTSSASLVSGVFTCEKTAE